MSVKPRKSNSRKSLSSNTSANNQAIEITTALQPFQLKTFKPITKTQAAVFEDYEAGDHLFLIGSAGTGKTFLGMYLALRELQDSKIYKKLYIVRSAVPVRDIGALPGDIEEKTAVYEQPYEAIADELYGAKKSYGKLKSEGKVEFVPTSFIRGRTLKDCIILVDEMQNLNFWELNSIMTRLGKGSKIIFSGDTRQSDLIRETDRQGLEKFLKIIDRMPSFSVIEFLPEDCVRSSIVKEYLLAAEEI